jgi:hypothetical protein
LIYLHIGKTAGVTLHQVLQRQFPRSQILWLHRVPRSMLLEAAAGSGLGAGPGPEARASGRRPDRELSLAYVASLPRDTLLRLRLIEGHTIFGIHRWVPRPAVYATFLRHPVARTFSGYAYIRRRPRHPLYSLSHSLSLGEFLRSGAALQLDNGQTRAIAGDTTTPFGECGPDLLEQAKRNIDRHFAVVGLTERFDESLLLLQRAFGWRDVRYVRANVSRRARTSHRADPAVRRVIEEYNQLDLELYEWVRDRVRRATQEDPSFDEQLRRFRRANALYRPWGHLTFTFPRMIRLAVRARGARGAGGDS